MSGILRNRFIISCAVPALVFAGRSSKDIFKEAEAYTVRIYARTITALETSERGSWEGSGFVFHVDRKAGVAFVATNKHVIGTGESSVQVSFKDGERFPATPIYIDPLYDFGVIRFSLNETGVPSNIAPARLGESAKVEVGHPVGAFGSPQGYEYSATEGIVSSTTNNPGEYGAFLQTDAALNPGNSGGPLISLVDGRVIGVNTVKSFYSEGISWALAIDQLKPIMNQVIRGEVLYTGHMGWSGVFVEEITVDRAEESFGADYGNKRPRKALLIVDVLRETPAESAGLSSGDIILAVNGRVPNDEAEYVAILRDLAGQTVNYRLCRFGESIEIKVNLLDRGAFYPNEYVSFAGMIVHQSTPTVYGAYYSAGTPECVFISDVLEGSSAEAWGIPKKYPVRGLLVKMRYYPTKSLDDFWNAVKDVEPGEPVEMFLGLPNYGMVMKVVYYTDEEAPARKKVNR
mgnify:CR=1 FL=1